MTNYSTKYYNKIHKYNDVPFTDKAFGQITFKTPDTPAKKAALTRLIRTGLKNGHFRLVAQDKNQGIATFVWSEECASGRFNQELWFQAA